VEFQWTYLKNYKTPLYQQKVDENTEKDKREGLY
jgi:hypothetical protein